jgi:thiamine pyrophosphate-dependent acetolactate synthase large subunit-like protein
VFVPAGRQTQPLAFKGFVRQIFSVNFPISFFPPFKSILKFSERLGWPDIRVAEPQEVTSILQEFNQDSKISAFIDANLCKSTPSG